MKEKGNKQEKDNNESISIIPIILCSVIITLLVIIILLLLFKNNAYLGNSENNGNSNSENITNKYEDDNNQNTDNNDNSDSNTTDSNNYIKRQDALDIALRDLKLKESDIRDIDIELDYKYNMTVYEVSFDYKDHEYEYYIDALTGNIIHSFKERDY